VTAADLDRTLRGVLHALMRELLEGPPAPAAFILNPGDGGLMASLARLSAADASARPGGRSSIAAHVEHLRYGFSLLNRWAGGAEDVFATAAYAASWERQQVDEAAWPALRAGLEREAGAWARALAEPRDWTAVSLGGAVSSIAHLAYHVGAIRQLAAAASGPAARD
jgi:hypothetical protein